MENLYILFSPKFWLYLIRKSPLKAAVVILIVGFFVWGLSSYQQPQPSAPDKHPETAAETAKQAADDKFKNQLMAAALGAATIKKSMRNPDSFKLESAFLVTNSDTVCYDYRAQNGFGGMNREHAVYVPKLEGIKTSEMRGFSKIWNKECAHKDGKEIKEGVEPLIPLLEK